MNGTPACVFESLVDRHFRRAVSPAEERRMREHLPACEACRARYDRWLLLERLDPAAPPAEQRLAHGLGFAQRRRGAWATALVAAACLVLVARFAHVTPFAAQGGAFTARGGSTSAAALSIYRVSASGKGAPVDSSIRRGDELAFSYLSPPGKRYLMVFGVDEHARVYWFYPAWTDGAEDPLSIEIAGSETIHDLPEAVRQDVEGDALRVYGLFTDKPLHVREVEKRLHALGDRAFADDVVSIHNLRVTP